ncbi:MAG: glycosyl hydrolase family 32 [Bryobacteraceae bacterium]
MLLHFSTIQKTLSRSGLLSAVILLSAHSPLRSEEVLYNGIRLPADGPPKRALTRKPMPLPYLEHRPDVIPIDVGRQLFVDDFLVASTTLQRRFHQPEMHPGNPVIRRDKAWEGLTAIPFSDGVWYDPQARIFKAWYQCARDTCYATSTDGIEWQKTALDVVPGTNIVLKGPRDSSTVWFDLEEKDASRRYKMLSFSQPRNEHAIAFRASADGIHWSDPIGRGRTFKLPNFDRTTMFFNPFRQLWIYSVRGSNVGPKAFPDLDDSMGRVRYYLETKDFARGWESRDELTPWVGADERDLPDPQIKLPAQLYNMDAVAYESLMLGLFCVWRGPDNKEVTDRSKRNEIFLGFSRDGFHWDRPNRQPFIGVSERRGDWNWGNVQSVGGGCLIARDKLYFYFSGRKGNPDKLPGVNPDSGSSTGLATLRRDGFASMDATKRGMLQTRPVRFTGKHLFVNANTAQGDLRVEVLDAAGRVIKPFTAAKCERVSADSTIQHITWKDAADLGKLSGQAVSFRFRIRKGSLYSFWVSPDASGASYGYVAAGGPGFVGPRDTVGMTSR